MKNSKKKSAGQSGRPPIVDDLSERVRRLMESEVTWVPAYPGHPSRKDDPRNLTPSVLLLPNPPTLRRGTRAELLVAHDIPEPMRRRLKAVATAGRIVRCTLEEFLSDYWSFGRWVLAEWVKAHAADLDDLFQRPEGYPALVVWSALCILKFSHEQAAALVRTTIQRSLRTGALYIELSKHGQALHERLGYTPRRDYTAQPEHKDDHGLPPVPPSPTDVESDLFEHIVTNVLNDSRAVRTNVLGYLYRAAERRLQDLGKETKAAKRPGLVTVPEHVDDEGQPTGEDDMLDAQSDRRESLAEAEAGERAADDLIERAQLTPRQRQVAMLLLERYSNAEIARKLGVKPPRITAILQGFRSNSAFQEAARRLEFPAVGG